jgi:ATP-dependent RNA helicase DDX21
MHGDIAQN